MAPKYCASMKLVMGTDAVDAATDPSAEPAASRNRDASRSSSSLARALAARMDTRGDGRRRFVTRTRGSAEASEASGAIAVWRREGGGERPSFRDLAFRVKRAVRVSSGASPTGNEQGRGRRGRDAHRDAEQAREAREAREETVHGGTRVLGPSGCLAVDEVTTRRVGHAPC